MCSVASEEIQFDDWGLDVVLSATQKGLGVPPGLSVLVASKKAIEVRLSNNNLLQLTRCKVFSRRQSPVTSYYASWKKYVIYRL